MQPAQAHIGTTLLRTLGGLTCVAFAMVAMPVESVAQDDTASVGPPPHISASWSPPGSVIDVSRSDVMRRRVTVDLTDVPLGTAIGEIRDRAGLNLIYGEHVLPAGRIVSIRARGLTVASALTEVLLDTGLDVVMTRGGHLALVMCPHVADGERGGAVISGRVTDKASGRSVVGAAVAVEGTSITATADADGRYRLAGLKAGVYTLTVRYIGFSPVTADLVLGQAPIVQDFALTPSVQQLEQMVVTGPLVPTEARAIPIPLTVITADDIRRQNVMRMDQLFRGQSPGAIAWDRLAEDYTAAINVRGANSLSTRPVKTFVDGIEVADPQFTALIDPNSIDRIELARGPQGSTMYGSDAIGGVLQVFTKKGKFDLPHPEGEVKGSFGLLEKNEAPGSVGHWQASASLSGGERNIRYYAAGYYRHDGEWTPSYKSTNWSATVSAENIQGPLTTRITAIFARKFFDRPWYLSLRDSGYTFFSKPPFQEVDVQTQTFGVNAVYDLKPWWRHDLVLGYDRSAFGLLQTERRFTAADDSLLQVIMNHRSKLSVFYHTTASARIGRSIDGALTVGFNHHTLDGSDVFSPATTQFSGALDGPANIVRVPSTNTGYLAQAQVSAARTVYFTAGIRAEQSPGFGENVGTVASPRLGVSYVRAIGASTVKLRFAYGESVRALDPAQNQFFANVAFVRLPNPALRPERQRGVDGGFDFYLGSQLSVSTTYFTQDAIDLVDQVFRETIGDPRQQSQQQNVGKIRNSGWELEGRYNTDRLQVSGSLSIVNSRIQQLAREYNGNYRVGDRLLEVPRSSAGVALAYVPFKKTMIRAGMTNIGSWVERDMVAFYGAVFGDIPRRPMDRDYWITYRGLTKFRAGVEQNFWGDVTGAFDVENIGNSRAFEGNNISLPAPRTFTLSFRTSY